MICRSKFRFEPFADPARLALLVLATAAFGVGARAQEADVTKKLEGFDAYMQQTLKDWNTPGVGVGIVVGDKLVFAKGYAIGIMRRSSRSQRKRCSRLRRTRNYSRR